jgi:hypothetical protein
MLSRRERVDFITDTIVVVGGRFMRDQMTRQRGVDLGFEGSAFGFGGRAGVLGDVRADVVTSVLAFFNPKVVERWWAAAEPVMPRTEAGRNYSEACADFGRVKFADVEGLARLAQLCERAVGAAEIVGLPLFAAWRSVERAEDDPGHAAQVLHILREHRGANHVVAIAAAGLTPLEAILVSGGEERARQLGFSGDFPVPGPGMRRAWRDADALTRARAADAYYGISDEDLEALGTTLVACRTALDG